MAQAGSSAWCRDVRPPDGKQLGAKVVAVVGPGAGVGSIGSIYLGLESNPEPKLQASSIRTFKLILYQLCYIILLFEKKV